MLQRPSRRSRRVARRCRPHGMRSGDHLRRKRRDLRSHEIRHVQRLQATCGVYYGHGNARGSRWKHPVADGAHAFVDGASSSHRSFCRQRVAPRRPCPQRDAQSADRCGGTPVLGRVASVDDRCAPSTAMVLVSAVLCTALPSRSGWCWRHQARAFSLSQGPTLQASTRRRRSAALCGRRAGSLLSKRARRLRARRDR